MPYVATVNVPGYLPMDDDPPVFDAPADAWEWLRDERVRDEDGYGPERSSTVDELERRMRWASSGLVCDFEAVGTVYGPTPADDYDGDHDLGLAYTVTEID